jgi:hypothetical protein
MGDTGCISEKMALRRSRESNSHREKMRGGRDRLPEVPIIAMTKPRENGKAVMTAD